MIRYLSSKNRSSGAALVEAALALPFLLLLLAGILNLAWSYQQRGLMMQAARQTTRLLAGWRETGTLCGRANEVFSIVAQDLGLDPAGYTLDLRGVEVTGVAVPNYRAVELGVNRNDPGGLGFSNIFGVTLRVQSVFLIERGVADDCLT